MTEKRKVNYKVIAYNLIAIVFLILTFMRDWIFIIGAIIFVFLGRKELFKKN